MKRLRPLALTVLCALAGGSLRAHDISKNPVTWNREISRLVYERCASCHRDGGSSFSLTTYRDAQPRAIAIRDAVLSRRMPPWGAVKGFGNFRNDEGLTQEQIELVAGWVAGGMARGNNPNALPPMPSFTETKPFVASADRIRITGTFTLPHETTVDGVWPEQIPEGGSMEITAVSPDGRVEPLVWLHEYRNRYQHPFLFRSPLTLPAGTVIRGLGAHARISLLPVTEDAK